MITGPIEPATPVVVAQIAIALARSRGGNTFTRIDSVDGMMNAAPTPIDRATGDDLRRVGRLRREQAGEEERREAELERALAPEAVAERARGEEQAREHEGVRRHHPLELRLGGAEVASERGEGDVEGRVAAEHDQQAQAQHGQRPPPAGVGLLGGAGVGRGR